MKELQKDLISTLLSRHLTWRCIALLQLNCVSAILINYNALDFLNLTLE